MYYSFAQWCNALQPGMHVVKTKVSAPQVPVVSAQRGETKNRQSGVKACAFLGSEKRLVIHVVNMQSKASDLTLKVNGDRYKDAVATVTKSSAKESNQAKSDITLEAGKLVVRLEPNEMATYIFGEDAQTTEPR